MKKIVVLLLWLGACVAAEKSSIGAWLAMTPWEAREKINQSIMRIPAQEYAVAAVKDQVITVDNRTTPVRIYSPPKSGALPAILFIHGGAWIAGNIDTHDNLARYFCAQAEAVVVSVGYTNSPEGKFPLPLQQCFDALCWLEKNAGEISVDVSCIAIVGDSAGGNMAAALCLMARDLCGPKISLQVLINPAPDLTCGGSLEIQGETFLDVMRWQAREYVSNSADVNNAYVSPLVAKDLTQLPKAVVILAEQDALREDGQKYADRLKKAGNAVEVYTQFGIGHLAGHGARAAEHAQPSLLVAQKALKACFEQQAQDSPATSVKSV